MKAKQRIKLNLPLLGTGKKKLTIDLVLGPVSTSYTIGCPYVCEDNPRALASGLSYVHLVNPWYNY